MQRMGTGKSDRGSAGLNPPSSLPPPHHDPPGGAWCGAPPDVDKGAASCQNGPSSAGKRATT